VTLAVHDSTLGYVVRELTRLAHFQVLYDIGNPVFAKRIDVRVDKANVMDALAMVLKGTSLSAKLAADGETVLILPPTSTGEETASDQMQTGIVTGRVTDSASGKSVSGATVAVKGTKLSTLTNERGEFILRDVPSGTQLLTVKLFGYKPVSRTMTVVDNGRVTLHVILTPAATILSGVVTTATGRQRKVEIGNAITTINVDSVMQASPVMSVTDLLATRVPGATILHSSGNPGDPARIRLRGASSITGNNDPIVIVDGVRVYASQSDARNSSLAPSQSLSYRGRAPYNLGGVQSYTAQSPLDQIDPNSIETIEVFEGPSASSMYGADAANGVIVITTKHGHSGPPRWNLALGASVNWLPGSWPTNYYRFGASASNHLSLLCTWDDIGCLDDTIVAFQALNDPRYTVFTHGSDQTASLSVSGGSHDFTYSLTGSTAREFGNLRLPRIEQERYEQFYGPAPGWMLRPDNYKTWGLNGNLTTRPSSVLQVTFQSSLFNSTKQTGSLQSAIQQLEGEYLDPTILTSSPLIRNDVERSRTASLSTTNALTVSWSPRPWLPLSMTGGINTMQRNDANTIQFGINSCAVNSGSYGQNTCGTNGGDTTGYYGLGRGTSLNRTLSVGTTIPVRFLSLGIGFNAQTQTTQDVSASTNQLAPGVSVPIQFPTTENASQFGQQTSAQTAYGWYVEPRFNLHNRFFVSPGFRLDGGSSTGSHAGLTGLPKLDFSYIAVENADGLLSSLRLRSAFGIAGTQPGPTDRLRLIAGVGNGQTNTVSLDGTTLSSAAIISSLGNTQLHPERKRELEGGFDAEFWRGRLVVSPEVYWDTRSNALIQVPVAPSVNGGGNIWKNIGVVRDVGTELTASVTVLENRSISWTVGGYYKIDQNRVVRLNPGQSTIILGSTRVEAGYPLFGTWANPIASFADINGDGIIQQNEIRLADSAVFVGQANPKSEMVINTNGTLFNGLLSFSANFDFQTGLTQFNSGLASSGALDAIANAPGATLATQAAIVATTLGQRSSQIGLIQTVNTFRFTDLSIGYKLPRSMTQWFRSAQNVTLAIQGSNLALHTNYRGKDPDVNVFSTTSGSGDQTADVGQIPQPRVWWLKVTIGN
jgi:TonB-linked SusC/RagA family outer membrane protein